MISYEDIHEHLQCGICRDIDVASMSFTPCGHLFCEDCARNFCLQSTTKCPVCNYEFRITRNVNMVPAYSVRSLLDVVMRKRRDICGHHGNSVAFHCLTCQEDDEVPICSSCLATTHVGHIVLPCNATDSMRSLCEAKLREAKLHASREIAQNEVVQSTPSGDNDSDIIEIDANDEVISQESSSDDSNTNVEMHVDETLPVEWYYAAMMLYRAEHNSYDIPTAHTCTISEQEVHLGSWLSRQKTLYEQCALPQSRYNILHALVLEGLLSWSPRDLSQSPEPAAKRQRVSQDTDEKFECLMKFALCQGNFCVPQGYTASLSNKPGFSLSLYLATNLEKLRGDVDFKNRSKFQLFMDASLLSNTRTRPISTSNEAPPPLVSTVVESSPTVHVIDISEPPIQRGTVVLFKYWSCGKIYGGLGLVLRCYNMSTTGESEIFYLVRQYYLPSLDSSVGPVDVLRDIPQQSILLRKVEMLGGTCLYL